MLSLLICSKFDLKCFDFPLEFVFVVSLFFLTCASHRFLSLFFLLPVHLSPSPPLALLFCISIDCAIFITIACAHVSGVSRLFVLFAFFCLFFLFVFVLSVALSLTFRRVPPCAAKTCAVRPVFARVVGELRAADESNFQGPIQQKC